MEVHLGKEGEREEEDEKVDTLQCGYWITTAGENIRNRRIMHVCTVESFYKGHSE